LLLLIEPETLILPGVMKDNRRYIEEVLGSKVVVGPMDSAQLPGLMRK
jgi:CO dehydrogenase/acetyl-CoA synthase gamma subunit (corrinoid Fe-S protein)